jgi:hypothetical protein
MQEKLFAQSGVQGLALKCLILIFVFFILIQLVRKGAQGLEKTNSHGPIGNFALRGFSDAVYFEFQSQCNASQGVIAIEHNVLGV